MQVNATPDNTELYQRRERVFLILAAVFICSMTLLNVVGITRFVQLGPMQLAIGVLPYPLTFLCTDLICELYGRARANFVVTLGLCLNLFIIGFMWLGSHIPAADIAPPWQVLELAQAVTLPNGDSVSGSIELFQLIYQCTAGAVFASMMAYVAAQYVDIRLFHFWKKLTRGKHLWLRNNLSTLFSQCVDSVVVVGVTFGAAFLAGSFTLKALAILVASNYFFKMVVALADTLPFYVFTHWLSRYLSIDNTALQ